MLSGFLPKIVIEIFYVISVRSECNIFVDFIHIIIEIDSYMLPSSSKLYVITKYNLLSIIILLF